MDFLQDYVPRIVGVSGSWETVVFAVLVIFMLWWLPGGVWSLIGRHLPRFAGFEIPASSSQASTSTAATRSVPRPRNKWMAPALKVVKARKTFGGLVAVNDVSFEVTQGTVVALIGPNGAGKSTMFDLITGVKTLTAGEVHVFGNRVDGKGARVIARQGVARTFQHVKLMGEKSVLENVMLGGHLNGSAGPLRSAVGLNRKEEIRLAQNALELLEQCGLSELAQMPAASLALGQQRIVEIARALALDPGLLLLDEPAAGLRLKEKQELKALIQSLRTRGMSVLLVEHDMDFVMGLVDRIVVMEYGIRIAEGTPSEIQADPRVVKAYLGEEA
jgi:branched-chain amino acid transport system permease protein